MTTATIQIDANASKAVQEFERLKARAAGSFGAISSEAQALNGTLGVLAGSAAAVSFVGMVKGAIDAGDSINKLTQRTGMSAESLSGYQYAANMADVSNEQFAKGIKALNISIAQSLAGDKEKVALFKQLGVSVTDASGKLKTTEQVLLDVADAYKGAHDGAGKVAIGQGLMGKASEEMIPLLNSGGDAIRGMKEEAEKLGLVISGDFARQAEEFNDNLTRLQTGSRKLGMDISTELLPTLQAIVQEMVNAKTAGGDVGDSLGTKVGGALRIATEAAAILGVNVSFVFKAMGTEIGGIAAQIASLFSFDRKTGDFTQFTAISDMMKADAERARAELDALERRILRLPEATKAAFEEGFSGSSALQDAGKRTLALASATSTAETEYQKLIKRIQERVATTRAEIDAGRELTDQEKFAVKIAQDMDSAKKALTKTERERLETLLKTSGELDLQRRIQASELKDAQAIAAERQKQRNAEYDQAKQAGVAIMETDSARIKTAREMLEQIEFETKLLGMNTAEREQATIARELERQGIKKGTQAWDEYADKIKNAAAARVQAQEAVEQFRGTWESIDGAAHEVWTSMWDKGSNVFKRLTTTLKTTLWDALYQMTVKKWTISLAASLTGAAPSVVQAATGAAGGAASSAGVGAAVGSMFGAGGLSGALMGGAGWLTGATTFTGALSAGASLVGTGTAAGVMSGMGMIAGALGPIALGVAAIMSFVKKGGGPKDEAGYTPGSLAGSVNYNNGNVAAAQAISDRISGSFATVAQALGLANQKLDVAISYAMDPKGTAQTQLDVVTNRGYSRGGRMGTTENAGRGEEDLAKEVAAEEQRAILVALRDAASGLAQKFRDSLANVDVGATAEVIQAAIQNVLVASNVDKALSSLGGGFADVASMAMAATKALVEASGGFDTLRANIGTFSENFYTDAEKRTRTIASISEGMASVGLSLDGIDLSSENARLQFRALVEGIDKNTDAGARQLAMVLSLSGAVASVTPALKEVSDAVDEVTGDVGLSVSELLEMSRTLLQEYRTATANVASAKAALREFGQQLHATADGIVAQINTLRGQAAQALASARENAQEALGKVRDANAQAQEKLTQAQGALQGALQGVASAINQAAAAVATATAATQSAFAAIKTRSDQAAAAALQAQATLDGALQAVAQAIGQAAGRVANATTTVQNAVGALSTRNDQAQQALNSAQDALHTALEGVARAVTTAAQNVASATASVQAARANITQGYLSALEREAAVKQRVTQAYLDAQSQVEAAQGRLTQAQQEATRAMRQAGDTILDTLRAMAGSNAGTGNSVEQYRFSRGSLDSLVARALAGDTQAAGQVSAAGQNYLASSRKVSSAQQLTEDDIYVRQQLARVMAKTGTSDGSGSTGSAGPDAVAQAQAELQKALEKAAAAQALAVQSGAGLVASNEDLAGELAKATLEVAKWSAAVTESGASRAAEEADLLAEYHTALDSLNAAQDNYTALLQATEGLDLDGIQLATNDWASTVQAATTARGALTDAEQAATAAASALETAMNLAAAAGVAIGTVAAPLDALNTALGELDAAQQNYTDLLNATEGLDLDGIQAETNAWAGTINAAKTAQENLTTAQQAATDAAADLEDAMHMMADAGVAIGEVAAPLDALSGALDALANAQDSQTALLEAAGTLDLDGIQTATNSWESAVNAATKARDDLTLAETTADTAAGDLASALIDAAKAGVSFAEVQTPLQQFRDAIEGLQTAQENAVAVQADLYDAGADLVTQYGNLQGALTTANGALADFESRVAGIDLTDFTDRLGDLLDNLQQSTGTQSDAYRKLAASPLGQQINSAYSSVLGRQAEEAGMVYWFDQLANGATQTQMLGRMSESDEFKARFAGGGDVQAISQLVAGFDGSEARWRTLYDQARASGINSRQVDQALGVEYGTALNWALTHNLPAFESGGWHAGGWALVGERGPELAYMPPARIYNASQTAAMTSDGGSQAQVSTLHELKTAIEAVATNTARIEKTMARALHRKGDAFATRAMEATTS